MLKLQLQERAWEGVGGAGDALFSGISLKIIVKV